MRIYFAGVVDPRAKRVCSELGVRNYLLSFAEKRAFKVNSDILESRECRLIVDSGAFSAWSKGKRIDLNEYADFAHALNERARCHINFVNLDVIPGRKGTRPTDYEREISAENSYKNWQKLCEQGIPTMNVFHQHERFYWLDEFKKHSDYIGISPDNDVSTKEKSRWLRKVLQWIGCSVRTHGFGVTAGPLLLNFPFFSVDSTTWLGGVKYGSYVSMNWKKFGLDQIPKRKFRDNLPRLAHNVVAYSRSADYKFRVVVKEILDAERFYTDLWSANGLTWNGPRPLESAVVALGFCGQGQFGDDKLTSKAVPLELARWLNDLKGAPLAVWLAHLMDSDAQGMSNLSVKWLERLTGLNYDTITAQRTWLSKNGWLTAQPETRLHRGRFWQKRFQVTLPLKPRALPPPHR